MNGTQQGARIAIGAATQHTADYLNPVCVMTHLS